MERKRETKKQWRKEKTRGQISELIDFEWQGSGSFHVFLILISSWQSCETSKKKSLISPDEKKTTLSRWTRRAKDWRMLSHTINYSRELLLLQNQKKSHFHETWARREHSNSNSMNDTMDRAACLHEGRIAHERREASGRKERNIALEERKEKKRSSTASKQSYNKEVKMRYQGTFSRKCGPSWAIRSSSTVCREILCGTRCKRKGERGWRWWWCR